MYICIPKQPFMKKSLALFLLVLIPGAFSFSQNTFKKLSGADVFKMSTGFIENIHQYDQETEYSSGLGNITYGYEGMAMPVLFKYL